MQCWCENRMFLIISTGFVYLQVICMQKTDSHLSLPPGHWRAPEVVPDIWPLSTHTATNRRFRFSVVLVWVWTPTSHFIKKSLFIVPYDGVQWVIFLWAETPYWSEEDGQTRLSRHEVNNNSYNHSLRPWWAEKKNTSNLVVDRLQQQQKFLVSTVHPTGCGAML